MARWLIGFLWLLMAVGPVAAAEPQGKLVKDLWDVAYLEGQKAGFFHTTVREVERDGQKLLRTALEMDLTIKRYDAVARLRMESGTEETPEGKVAGVFMRQYLDKGQQLVLNGTVDGKQLHVKVDGGRIDKKVRWNDEVIGLYRQQYLFKERKAKPGDQFNYMSFEPSIDSVVTIRVTVKDYEEVEMLNKTRKRLLRVEAVPDKIEFQGKPVPLPSMTTWLDGDLLPVRSQIEIPGVGKVLLYRTTKEVATTGNGATINLPDLGSTTLVALNKPISRPHEAKGVVYRITVKGDDDPATTFAQDERQEIKNLKGNTFEMHIRALRQPPAKETSSEVKDEFLKSCYYLDSDDNKVKERAARAVGKEEDPWKKARLIESWVHASMRKSNTVGFTTAAQIARNLEGDCRQHAMLMAAMCRAVGVPSRTALGLVYVNDRQRGPMMGFHMWTEVWIKGQWLGLDATLGQGSVGAAHLKIADHSWYDTQSLTPLLPVARVLGKIAIEVVSVTNGD